MVNRNTSRTTYEKADTAVIRTWYDPRVRLPIYSCFLTFFYFSLPPPVFGFHFEYKISSIGKLLVSMYLQCSGVPCSHSDLYLPLFHEMSPGFFEPVKLSSDGNLFSFAVLHVRHIWKPYSEWNITIKRNVFLNS